MKEDRLLTLKELSKYLKLSTYTIYRMVKNAEIPCMKIGKKWRFKKSRIEEWLSQKERYKEKKPEKMRVKRKRF